MDDPLQHFFGLTEPFGSVGDPADLFRASSRAGLLAGIVNQVLSSAVVTSVRGGCGVGKTSFARMLAAELAERDVMVVLLDGVVQNPLKVQRQLGEALNIVAAATMEPDQLLQALQAQQEIRQIVLLFDNADAVSVILFRYLQLLVDLFEFGTTQLSIILIGGFGQWTNLEQPGLEPIRSAATSFNMLFSLRDNEATTYLEHKFERAGRALREVMSRSAVKALLAHVGGNPAQLDAVVQDALQLAFANSQKRVTLAHLRRALPADQSNAGSPRRRLPQVALASALLIGVLGAGAWVFERNKNQTDVARRTVASSVAEQPQSAPPLVSLPTPNLTAATDQPAPDQPAPEQSAELKPPATPPLDLAPASPPASDPGSVSASQSYRLSRAAPSTSPGDLSDYEPGQLATTSLPVASDEPAPDHRAPGEPALGQSALDRTALDQPELDQPVPAETGLEKTGPTQTGSVGDVTAAAPDPIPPPRALETTEFAASRPLELPPAAPDTTSQSSTTPAGGVGQRLSTVVRPPSEHILQDDSAPPPSRRGGPGLVLVARGEDSMKTLYTQIYRGVTPPPYSALLAANPSPVRAGALLIFPEPPDGWSTRRRTP